MPSANEKMMLNMGKFYEKICRLPGIGEPMARSFARSMGRLIFYTPGSGANRQDSIEGVKKYLLETGRKMSFPFEIVPGSESPDRFEFYVNYCPYGFKGPDQEKPCDAAMNMDKVLFLLLGAELTILESVVRGAPRCRMLMKWKDVKAPGIISKPGR